jgi:hypothetical protein
MKSKKIVLSALAALGFALTASQAIAAPIAFDFSTSTGLLGTSKSYTVGATTITAYSGSYSGNTVTRGLQLDGVHGSTGNQGLGVCKANGECTDGDGNPTVNLDGWSKELIQLDLTDLYADGYSLIKINSDRATANGETLKVYASSTSASLGTLLASIADANGDFSISTGNLKYLNFIASSSDNDGATVLLHSLTADVAAVPEPATCGGQVNSDTTIGFFAAMFRS